MKELVKLEALTKKVADQLDKHFDNTKKIVRVVKKITVAWTVFTVVATAVSLIPRYEKLDVDGEELIDQCKSDAADDAPFTALPEENS